MPVSKAAQEIYDMQKLKVSQQTGQVSDGHGNIVGRRKWVVDVDYSLDMSNRELIVNAASVEEAEDKVNEILAKEALRRNMELGNVFVNMAAPEEEL